MDVLKNKYLKDYSYVSRYSNFYSAYNSLDDKYITEITSQLKNTTTYVLHQVKENESLDYLANKYYGRPDLFWIIADFNRITDAFINLYDYYKEIKIPSISSVQFEARV